MSMKGRDETGNRRRGEGFLHLEVERVIGS